MIPFLLIAAVAWWLAAPDPVTAGARTASGTAAKAAGTGARAHWAAGRESRQVRRTKRRDRWWKAGGLRRAALRGEHAAVWTCGAAKTTAGLAAAAAKPVPAAAKKGWSGGRERHRAKAGGRPVPVALDPPWWHREQPTEQPGEQVPGQGQNTPEDSPGAGMEQPPGTDDLDAGRDPNPDDASDTATCHLARDESTATTRCGAPWEPWQTPSDRSPSGWIYPRPWRATRHCRACRESFKAADQQPEPEPTRAEAGYGRCLTAIPGHATIQALTGWADDDRPTWESRPLETNVGCPNEATGPDLYCDEHRPGGGPGPLKTDPDPTDTTTEQPATPTPTEGAHPVSVNMPSEINDLTTLHSFAQAVIDDAEENGPGSQYAAAAASISEYFGRDFGREVNATASAFEEAAAALNQAWTAMVEAAESMKNESLATIGG